MLAISTGAYLASTAMDKLTAQYDAQGNVIETTNSKWAKTMKSFSGEVSMAGSMLAQMPGKMGKLGGAVGQLTAAWEMGVTIGQGLNEVFDKLGWTGEETAQSLADVAQKSEGLGGKFLRFISGTGKAKEQTDKVDDEATKRTMASLLKKGLSEKEAKTAMTEAAKKDNMSVFKYLEQSGRLPKKGEEKPKPVAPTTTPPKPGTTSALTGAKIPANAAKELAKMGATPEQVAATSANAAAAPAATAAGAPTGSFAGGPNPDGSITLKIDNFMTAFAKSNTMAKQGAMR
jgi:hypothetical protein